MEYNNNYSKTSGSLWVFYRDEPALGDSVIVDFVDSNTTDSFKFKECWNSGTIEIFEWFLENPFSAIN